MYQVCPANRRGAFGIRTLKLYFISLLVIFCAGFFSSGPEARLDPYWQPLDATSEVAIDHSLWQGILDDYLQEEKTGPNRFDYEGLKQADDQRMGDYLTEMQSIDPRGLPREAQMAYWINMYNALTVRVVTDNYPIESITDIEEGLFSGGPWDEKVIQVNDRQLTLNEIEHRILRPVFKDYRIHFAVNCASIGCPDLSPRVFTAANLEDQLNRLTRDYLSDPRGIEFGDNKLYLSKLFKWYRDDFGDSEEAVVETLSMHVDKDKSARLKQYSGEIDYRYDWSLNSL